MMERIIFFKGGMEKWRELKIKKNEVHKNDGENIFWEKGGIENDGENIKKET